MTIKHKSAMENASKNGYLAQKNNDTIPLALNMTFRGQLQKMRENFFTFWDIIPATEPTVPITIPVMGTEINIFGELIATGPPLPTGGGDRFRIQEHVNVQFRPIRNVEPIAATTVFTQEEQ